MDNPDGVVTYHQSPKVGVADDSRHRDAGGDRGRNGPRQDPLRGYGLYRDDGTPIIENGRHDDATSLSAVLFYPDG